MAIGSRGYRDERRRRVMLDESRSEERVATVEPPRGGKRKRYAPDALAGSQPHITDFLPERRRTILIILSISLLSCITALLLFWFSPQWEAKVPRDSLNFLQTFQPGGLLNLTQGLHWFISTALCCLIFALRRRRLDDYRGTYRIWAVSAALLAMFGIYCVLPLAPLLTLAITKIPRLPALENPSLYNLFLMGVTAGVLLIRWLIEVRRCRLAQSCFVAAGVLAALSLVQVVPLLKLTSYQLGEVITGSLYLASLVFMLAGLLVYGRHVRLDAQGLIAHGKKKVVKKKRVIRVKKVEEDEASEDDANEETEEADSGPVIKSAAATISRQAASAKDESEEEEDTSDDSRLSRAERKKLRREQRKAS